jgi:hypothetical protein
MRAAGSRGELDEGASALMKDLQTRHDAISDGLKKNPIATTVANSPNQISNAPPPLDFSSDGNLAAGLQARAKIAQFATNKWKPPTPVAALDEPEVQQVKAMLATPDPALHGRVLKALSALPPDLFSATLAKLGADDTDSMVTAAAGSMMRTASPIAESILRGQQTIKTAKEYLPKGDGETAAWALGLNDRLPASIFSLGGRTDATGGYAVAQGMVKARYADLSAQSADTTGKLNPDRLQQAVNDVTGGVLDHNGGKLIAPARGMPQSTFDRTMYGLTDADLPGVSTLNGQAVTSDYLRSSATLESVGDGRYFVKLGKDPMKPVYAYQGANTESPQKFMLDLRNRPLGVAPVALMGGAGMSP